MTAGSLSGSICIGGGGLSCGSPEGERLSAVRIVNDPLRWTQLVLAGSDPEVVLEATYGWYWAADVLACGRVCIWRIRWGSRVSRTGG